MNIRSFTESVQRYWQGPWTSRDPALANYMGYGPTVAGVTVPSDAGGAFWVVSIG